LEQSHSSSGKYQEDVKLNDDVSQHDDQTDVSKKSASNDATSTLMAG